MDAINLRRAIADAETLLSGPNLVLHRTAARTLRNLLEAVKAQHGDGRASGTVYVLLPAGTAPEQLYVDAAPPRELDLTCRDLEAYQAVIGTAEVFRVDGA
jgi:hypothetical protein